KAHVIPVPVGRLAFVGPRASPSQETSQAQTEFGSSPHRPRCRYLPKIRRQRGKVAGNAREFGPAGWNGPGRTDKWDIMARYDFRSPRLFLEAALSEGAIVTLAPNQANYLVNVLRLKSEANVLVFNGRDGEWRARLGAARKKGAQLVVIERRREQTTPGDLHYLFSPLKHARLDYVVQKAVEMGVSRLQPVIMRHTQTERVNLDRMRANAIEASEQCGILTIPDIAAPITLDAFVQDWVPERLLVFCDEKADVKDPIAALRNARDPVAIA